MFDQGLLNEVEGLKDSLGNQASEALGYKQLLAYFEGKSTLEEAQERIKILTRRYAKQQRTWLKRFKILPSANFIDMDEKGIQYAVEQALMHIS